jgi:hypothetical protein
LAKNDLNCSSLLIQLIKYIDFIADIDGLINQAVLMGNLEAAVEMCIHDGRWAEAVILAIAGGPELLARTQKKYFKNNKDNTTRVSLEEVKEPICCKKMSILMRGKGD